MGCSSHLSVWKAARTWFLSTMASSWGRESVALPCYTISFPTVFNYSPLPHPCWPIQSRIGADLILTHSRVVLGALHVYYIPWNVRTLQIYIPGQKRKKRKQSTKARYLFSGKCLRNVRVSWKSYLSEKWHSHPWALISGESFGDLQVDD